MLSRKPVSLAMGLGCIAILWASPLCAQDQDEPGYEEETVLEEVIVTGSIIRRPETDTASPVSVFATAMSRVSA